jgi:hypothetical protein
MAPKGKKGKKAGDDWDEGLGESADPIAQADADAKAADAAAEDEEESGGGGGLMAALKKNKERRKKKGKTVEEIEDEGDTVTPTVDESLDLAAKAPEEATMDDEFGGPAKKGKGGKGGKQQPAKEAENADEEGGGVKTKAQKEKEKKEREKQRKKENVCSMQISCIHSNYRLICTLRLLSRRSPLRLPHLQRKRMTPRLLPTPPQLLRQHPKLLEVRRRSCLLVSQRSRSSKRSSRSAKKKRSDSEERSWLVLKKMRD